MRAAVYWDWALQSYSGTGATMNGHAYKSYVAPQTIFSRAKSGNCAFNFSTAALCWVVWKPFSFKTPAATRLSFPSQASRKLVSYRGWRQNLFHPIITILPLPRRKLLLGIVKTLYSLRKAGQGTLMPGMLGMVRLVICSAAIALWDQRPRVSQKWETQPLAILICLFWTDLDCSNKISSSLTCL